MVAPVIGPITNVSQNTIFNYRKVVGYKQSRPFDRVLPYESYAFSGGGNYGSGAQSFNVRSWPDYSTIVAQVTSQCYERYKSNFSHASLGVTLAELGQSTSMIANRLVQLYQFGRQLKRGNIVGAANVLSTPVPKKASKRRKFADNWLEYSFGWAPLVGDIFSAIDLLQQPIKDVYARGSAKAPIANNLTTVYPDTPSGGGYVRAASGSVRMRMGARVAISNPNLYLANQLGLVNLAVIGYELIPFSFVANWFFNVEQFLSLGTDFLGLAVTQPYTTTSTVGFLQEINTNVFFNPWPDITVRTASGFGQGKWMNRVDGISSPTFIVRPWSVPGWRRCLTAASLLVQQMKV